MTHVVHVTDLAVTVAYVLTHSLIIHEFREVRNDAGIDAQIPGFLKGCRQET